MVCFICSERNELARKLLTTRSAQHLVAPEIARPELYKRGFNLSPVFQIGVSQNGPIYSNPGGYGL